MDNLQASRIVGGNTAYKRIESDFYPTPPEATIALLDFLKLPKSTKIWEPACGENHMVQTIKSMGYSVIGSDIRLGEDFLTIPFKECDWIITNPPFSLSEGFIKRCRYHNRPFALLLKSQYWHAKKRQSVFNEIRPNYILPLTWRPDFLFKTRGKGAPLMDVMWVVWGLYSGSTYPLYIPLNKPVMKEVAI